MEKNLLINFSKWNQEMPTHDEKGKKIMRFEFVHPISSFHFGFKVFTKPGSVAFQLVPSGGGNEG